MKNITLTKTLTPTAKVGTFTPPEKGAAAVPVICLLANPAHKSGKVFGLSNAKRILANLDAIKQFVAENTAS